MGILGIEEKNEVQQPCGDIMYYDLSSHCHGLISNRWGVRSDAIVSESLFIKVSRKFVILKLNLASNTVA